MVGGWSNIIRYNLGMTKEESFLDRLKANRDEIKSGGFNKWKKKIRAKAKAESEKDSKQYDATMKQGYKNIGAEFSANNKKIMDEMRKQDREERRKEWADEDTA